MFFKFSYKSVKAGLPASFWRIFTGLQGFNELFYRNVTGLFHRLYRVFTGFCTIFKGFYRFYQTQAFATAGMRILGMKTHSTIVDQNYKFKISEMQQNEAFWVEAHSKYFTRVEENFKFKSSETHQNEEFLVKSTSNASQ